MIFACKRTSVWDGKPCGEAFEMQYVRRDIRTVDDPAKLTYNNAATEWYERGKNHRVENGRIVRDFDDTSWFVEIEDFDDFLAFVKRYDSVIVEPWYFNTDYLLIEIYDGYRE